MRANGRRWGSARERGRRLDRPTRTCEDAIDLVRASVGSLEAAIDAYATGDPTVGEGLWKRALAAREKLALHGDVCTVLVASQCLCHEMDGTTLEHWRAHPRELQMARDLTQRCSKAAQALAATTARIRAGESGASLASECSWAERTHAVIASVETSLAHGLLAGAVQGATAGHDRLASEPRQGGKRRKPRR